MKLPFEALETSLHQEIKENNISVEAKNRIDELTIKKLEIKAAKNRSGGSDDKKQVEEIAAIRSNRAEVRPEPILFINPSSTEAMLDSMEFDGAVSWCVAEGESFVNLIKQGAHAALLNAWNMERAQRTRRTSASTDIKEPFLTLYVAMQPEKLLELTGR